MSLKYNYMDKESPSLTEDSTFPENDEAKGLPHASKKKRKLESEDEVEAREIKRISEDLSSVHDIPMRISCELGRAELSVRQLLSIDKGTTIDLEKLAGEPLEVLINQRTVARGEVVVINDKYGIRLTDIIDPSENGERSKISK